MKVVVTTNHKKSAEVIADGNIEEMNELQLKKHRTLLLIFTINWYSLDSLTYGGVRGRENYSIFPPI